MAGIWDKVTEVSSPSWSTVTVLNSITYKENYEPTPSIDLVNAWNLIDIKWEHFTYDYEDLII